VGPGRSVGIQGTEPLLRLAVRGQISQMHVVIASGQQGIAQGHEHPRFLAAEVVREDKVERRASLRLIFIVPMGALPAAAAFDLFYRETEEEKVRFSGLLRHFDGGAVAGSDR